MSNKFSNPEAESCFSPASSVAMQQPPDSLLLFIPDFI
jgi:hypothetical protein